MTEHIAGVAIPASRLVTEATELVRSSAPPLLFHHSRRVYLFGMLQGQRRGLQPDPEPAPGRNSHLRISGEVMSALPCSSPTPLPTARRRPHSATAVGRC